LYPLANTAGSGNPWEWMVYKWMALEVRKFCIEKKKVECFFNICTHADLYTYSFKCRFKKEKNVWYTNQNYINNEKAVFEIEVSITLMKIYFEKKKNFVYTCSE